MADTTAPQIYLVTPAEFELSIFSDKLQRVLDVTEIACVRLAMATRDEVRIARAADALREVMHQRDIALVIAEHQGMVERLGLDGVHLLDGSRNVRAVRKSLGSDAIIGAFCGTSKHDGMTAAESGADYVAFGPVGATGLGDGSVAELDLFEWWSEMIEVPVVAEGALTTGTIGDLAAVTDFLGIGDEIWATEDPAATLANFSKLIS
jgi:thiamine-phosphate pyrophosphorylase